MVEVKGKIGKVTAVNGITGEYLVMIGLKNERYSESELSLPKPVKSKKSKKELVRKKKPKEKTHGIVD
jgi:hypothetical protein